jgi:hypothetical protein
MEHGRKSNADFEREEKELDGDWTIGIQQEVRTGSYPFHVLRLNLVPDAPATLFNAALLLSFQMIGGSCGMN